MSTKNNFLISILLSSSEISLYEDDVSASLPSVSLYSSSKVLPLDDGDILFFIAFAKSSDDVLLLKDGDNLVLPASSKF